MQMWLQGRYLIKATLYLKGSHRFTSLHLALLSGWDLYKCTIAESVQFVQAGKQALSFVFFVYFPFQATDGVIGTV